MIHILTSKAIKKFFFAAIMVISTMAINTEVIAQTSKLEIEVEVTNAGTSGSADGAVLISVDGNEPGYIYLLYDKEPWYDGTILDKSKKMRENEYMFSNLKPGNYVVCVSDKTLHTRCKRFSIESEY